MLLALILPVLMSAGVLPEPPGWIGTGGVGALGGFVIWWLLCRHIPTMARSYEATLDKVLADSKANRDSFTTVIKENRDESAKREQALMERNATQADQLLQLVRQSIERAPPP